ncbi:ABC transporter substrate-binding protein [Cellulomonas fengjieae]|uniref:Spermidine/putrescine ABC transporter substrate-binding protein n=1 Tax=Cellulomonas fengjieae TaxID=2819978 RepID=A0ABS3SF94_9CELL|nr:spermidine/putrescine ABC transporter substrate-binding protein [Cellulomonas fengjieae]MBO3084423.1 spermidine/putrescine ABC transporter substrate-binding protein [Cellulomonas fengjieae]QVI67234.1 spermidine/putrescine ABC transporter substrate-binding protein [Cellulomonas fengjieae]
MRPHRRPVPADPRVRALVAQAANRGAMSRRSFLVGALGTAGVGAVLAACGTGSPSTGASSAQDLSGREKVVRWANWTQYLDQDEDGTTYPSLQAFEEQSGIAVTYAEDVDDNDAFYGKVSGQLKNGQDIGYDIVTLTDWMAARMIRQGYTQQLDRSRMPHADNILPNLADVDFDEGRLHSLTWQSGFAGLAWDKEKVPGGLHTLSDLWAPELAGRVEVLSEMRDTIGLIMLDQGVDPSGAWTDDDFHAALEVLREKIDSGHIRQVRGNAYTQDLASGDAIAVIGWSGDITSLNYEADGRFEFALPEAGGTLWSDNLLVPVGSPHRRNAEDLMNYYYDPEVAAQVAAWVNYITPVQGAQEAMLAIDPELAEDPMIFPTEEILAGVRVFRTLTPDEEERYNGEFLTVIGA